MSQPLRSASNHAWPNWSLLYPVFGARPLTVRPGTAANAVPAAAWAGDAPPGAGVDEPAEADWGAVVVVCDPVMLGEEGAGMDVAWTRARSQRG